MRARANAGRLRGTRLIAPCGMNCGLCIAYRRNRNPCPGCRTADTGKPKTRAGCLIKACAAQRGGSCAGCPDLPCALMRRLDGRYRAKYGMSMVANLRRIEAVGRRRFLQEEAARWRCTGCGATISVHRLACLACGKKRAAHQMIAPGTGDSSF